MSWGRRQKKKKTSSSSSMISIAKMFPISWISRLRQGNGNDNERRLEKRISERKAKTVKSNEEKSHRAEIFFEETDDNYWRLSFRDEVVPGRKSTGQQGLGGCPESYNWIDETEFSPSASTCRSCGSKCVNNKLAKKESKTIDFNSMLLDMNKSKNSNPQLEAKTRDLKKSEMSTRDGKLKNLDLHQLSHVKLKCTKKVAEADPNIIHTVKDIAEVEAVKPPQASVRNSRGSLSKKGDISLTELSLGGGEDRKSIYINKDSLKRRSKSGRSSNVRVYSPRTPSKSELCKIRALEELKKTRMKRVKVKAVVESLAVVKSSFDPEQDFRNSMVEMILDKGIYQQEELEELLACYLILNSDEYHDMIIKVFRQVWFDLNTDRLDPLLRNADQSPITNRML